MRKRAESGTVTPIPGDATVVEHRNGNTKSGRSSWSMDFGTSYNYARYGDVPDVVGFGYLYVKAFNPNSVNYCDMGEDDIYNDSEVLIKGVVPDCLTIEITPFTNAAEVMIIIKSYGL